VPGLFCLFRRSRLGYGKMKKMRLKNDPYKHTQVRYRGHRYMDWIVGAAGSGLMAGAAYRKGSLSKSGALAAVGVGTVLYALGSLIWIGLMIGFFVSSTSLTKWKHHLKSEAEAVYQKTGRRDAGQVWANGGLGTLMCAVHSIRPEWDWVFFAYIGIMATVTADTWATEVGGLSRTPPRSILTWKVVSKGTSGGVSILGWVAAACGAAFIGGLSVVLSIWDPLLGTLVDGMSVTLVIVAALIAGWLGANADSIMGATVQALYRCGKCGKVVESRIHCMKKTESIRGIRWLDNDAVNMLSSVIGGAICVIILLKLRG
jgi:uncharacterized protein (TIGR00297 family)